MSGQYQDAIDHIIDSDYGSNESRQIRRENHTSVAVGAIADSLVRIAEVLERIEKLLQNK